MCLPCIRVFIIFSSFLIVNCQEYDCDENGVRGKCVDIRDCPSARKDLQLLIKPKICSFNGTSNIPIVCCVNLPVVVDKSSESTKSVDKDGCPLLPKQYRPKETQIKPVHRNTKAWTKCLEYQESVLFECAVGGRQNDTKYRTDRCFSHHHRIGREAGDPEDPVPEVFGGVDSLISEFKHMALLGYGEGTEKAQWLCGGSLISDKFILTAGHCISNAESGTVSYAALGSLRRSDLNSLWNIYKIKNIVRHPEYKPPSKYNDIALLETDEIVKFNDMVVPACLHVGDEIPDRKVIATGWGANGRNAPLVDVMQNVPLWKVPDSNCSSWFPPHRHLKNGIDANTQVCYGDDGQVRDTCSGDSGGPLQIVSQDIYCMYLIVGVTSFGYSNCAQLGHPGIYIRVAPYVPWIESVVWP